jgi:hypothetical protein
VLRLDRHRFLVTAEARAPTGAPGAARDAVRHEGRWLRLVPVVVDPPAALTAGGPVVAPEGARVRGADAPPAGWDCPPGPAPRADLAVADSADTAGVHASVPAAPQVDVTPGARDDARWTQLGDDDWDAVSRRAAVVIAAGAALSPSPRVNAAGGCVADASAWGEPWRGAGSVVPCAAVAPVVHVRGAGVTRLVGPARAQGVILVDGDLRSSATCRWSASCWCAARCAPAPRRCA